MGRGWLLSWVLLFGSGVVLLAGPSRVAAKELLAAFIEPGHGVPISPAAQLEARALGDAREALAEGDLDRADRALLRAAKNELLWDYVAFYSVQILKQRGRFEDAAAGAQLVLVNDPESRLAPELHALRGAALSAAGKEPEARLEWEAALDATRDLERRRELKLAIVESKQRSGELDRDESPETLILTILPDRVLAAELLPGQRSGEEALEAAAELLAAGRGADAIEAYEEALGGELSDAQRTHAQMQRGRALFRLRRYTEAVAVFATQLPDEEARYWRARSSARAGRAVQAISEFEALAQTAQPEIASRSLYLAGLLLEDRNESERAMAHFARAAQYSEFPHRVAESLWRIAWSAFRSGQFAVAEQRFREMVPIQEDPLDQLRPRYWAARSAASGESGPALAAASLRAREDLDAIAREYPFSYYGLRAQEQLGKTHWRAQAETRAEAQVGQAGGVEAAREGSGEGSDKARDKARDEAREEQKQSESSESKQGGEAREQQKEGEGLRQSTQGQSAPDTILPSELERVALLLEAGLGKDAALELRPLAERTRGMGEDIAVGRLLVAAGDYYRAQRLVVNAYNLPLSQGVRPGREMLWWLSWPPAYRELVLRAVPQESDIEPALIWAIMREESSFRPEVMSSAGAMGLLQLMPETARRTAERTDFGAFEVDDLFTPGTNIPLGARYLDHLAGRFPGRPSAMIGSYNAGPLAVARWLQGEDAKLADDVWVENIPYGQTKSYVKRVLRSLHIYRMFY